MVNRALAAAGGLALAAAAFLPLPAPAATGNARLVAEAEHYEHGEGVPQNFARARALYCTAAQDGDATAAFNLGWMFLNARGVGRDDAVAAVWLRLAAQRGNRQAPQVLHLIGPQRQVAITGCATPATATAPIAAPPKIARLVAKTAPRYRVDPKLVLAVIATESGFQADAVSPRHAQGLMQLLPETARRFGVKDVFDPAENIRGGVRYLHWLLGYFDGDLRLSLAAYNAGEQAVLRYGGVPPYAETHSYLQRIASLYPVPLRPPPMLK